MNRRRFLATTAATTLIATRRASALSQDLDVEVKTIGFDVSRYCGWPTVAKRRNGELMLVYSGSRESHVCPFGKVEFMRSTDQGESWTWPQIILDGPLDDRDAGILETDQGTLLATSFSSLAYEPALLKAEKEGGWDASRLARWQAAHHRLPDSKRKSALGVWMTRSTDGGQTWSGRYDCRVNSPHGPIQMRDGRQLYAGKDLWREGHRVGFCISEDDGQQWSWLAELPTRPGDRHEDYHELHVAETASGKLVAQIRNHNPKNAGETLQSESTDGGKSWSVPHSIGVWGLPSHLLVLGDGRMLMSYGHRRAPLGNQIRISQDEGESWSDPIVIYGDGESGDLGYPSTVPLDGNRMLTVWYEKIAAEKRAVLRQARWRLPS